MAKAGGQAKLIQVPYDPTTTTLEQFDDGKNYDEASGDDK